MCVVDGPADEVVPEQHGHLEVGLLGRHVSRHGRPEGPSPENHHLRNPPLDFSQSDPARKRASKSKPRESYLARALEDVAAVAAAPGAGPPDQLLPRDAHRAATVLAAAPAWRGAGVVVVVAGVLVLRRRHGISGAGEYGRRAADDGGGEAGPRSRDGGKECGGGGGGGHWRMEEEQFRAAFVIVAILSVPAFRSSPDPCGPATLFF